MRQEQGETRCQEEKKRRAYGGGDLLRRAGASFPSPFPELDFRWLEFSHSAQDPATASRAISIMERKVLCLSSAVVPVPLAMWSDTVRIARASRPNWAARV